MFDMKKILGVLSISLMLFACGDDSSSGSSEQVEPLTPQEQIDDTTTTSPVRDTSDGFTDPRDGKTYKTVTIGEQTWMAENLNYADENIGQGDERYTWAEAQIACPDGWHLSTEREWHVLRDMFLADYLTFAGGVVKDSIGWVFKSASGWESDTVNGNVVSGNGGNILGFDIKPTGICFGSSCIRQGIQTGFWTQDPRTDDHAEYIAFERTTNWVGVNNILIDDARLHVRCVSDENSVFAKLGKCTSEKEGITIDSTSKYAEYYTCKENIWSQSTDKELLDILIDTCDTTRLNERRIYDGVNYTCVVKVGGEYIWQKSETRAALDDCLANGDTICRAGFEDGMYILRDGEWKQAYVSDVFGDCTEARRGEIVKFGSVDYICRESWDFANSIEVELGACDDSKLYDTLNLGAKYICVDHSWRLATRIDDELGFCFDDGAVGEYDGHKYTCDAKDHKWYYEMIDERDGQKYKAIWVEFEWDADVLVMAEDLKFGGDSLYTWADAQTACPDGWRVPSDAFVQKLKNAIRNKKDLTISTRTLMSQSGWKVNGSNWSGLNLQPNAIDTIKLYVYDGVKDTSYYVHDEYKLNSWFWLSDEEGSYAGIQERVDENGEEDYVMFKLDISDFDTPVEKAAVRCIKE